MVDNQALIDDLDEPDGTVESACGKNGGNRRKEKGRSKEEKQQWSIQEDLLISVFVEKYGMKKWNIISDEITKRVRGSNRNGK